MSMPSNAMPRALVSLLDLLGARPDPARSDGWHWRLVACGTALFALGVPRGAGWGSWGSSFPGDPYAWLVQLCVGISTASLGASGLLLRRGNRALSPGFSVLQALLFFPMSTFLLLMCYEWLGLAWAAGVPLTICAVSAVRWKRSQR